MPFPRLRLAGFFTEPVLTDADIHRISGAPDRVEATHVPEELTVVSWNIAYGRHADRVLRVLERMEPDVCLLQEVDTGCRRSGFRNIAAWLADRLEMNWLFAGEFQEIGEGQDGQPALTGQAILSRARLSNPVVIPFSRQATLRWRANPIQPRRGNRMALGANSFRVRLYNLHVESGKTDDFRRQQVDDVIVGEQRSIAENGAIVVAGDFNCGPCGHTPLLEALSREGFADPFKEDPATRRTSVRHRHALDWIFLRGLAPVFAAVGDRLDASDHAPVIVRVRLASSSPV